MYSHWPPKSKVCEKGSATLLGTIAMGKTDAAKMLELQSSSKPLV